MLCAKIGTDRMPLRGRTTAGNEWANLRDHTREEVAYQSAEWTVALNKGEVWSLAVQPGVHIVCTTGVLWVTQSGESRDYILQAGGTWTADRRGTVVVQALSRSHLQWGHAIAAKPMSSAARTLRHISASGSSLLQYLFMPHGVATHSHDRR